MRHRIKTQNLSRFSSYYKATVRSLARAVIVNQRIVTTKVRAKITRPLVEKLISLGKEIDSLAARRRAYSILCDHQLVHKLFSDIGPNFAQKNGGYTRIIPYKRRRGDNAELVVLELSVQKARPLQKQEKPLAKKAQDKQIKDMAAESVRERKAEHKESAPSEKEKHKKDKARPAKRSLGGLGKIFKSERDSL
ncbi:MAG TPA: 50S ribosomal protein L17 [Candidatus Omnitrophica bacterium]|nr:50S ribosomal protein L17 [Candidatus Omnitrophota bacterium]